MCYIIRQCFGVDNLYGSWLELTFLAEGWDVTGSNNPHKKMMWHACMSREFNHNYTLVSHLYIIIDDPSTDAHGLIVYQIFILRGASHW
jgi:hypothetical protein